MSGKRDAITVTTSILRTRRAVGLVGIALFLAIAPLPIFAAAKTKVRSGLQEVQERHRERYAEFSTQIEKLAFECESKKLVNAAQSVRERAFVPDPQSFHVDKLPSKVRPDLPADLPADERMWQSRLRNLETGYAKDLYLQARRALTQGFPSYAYNLVREAALHDPDNSQVRKVLGFERHKNEWLTPFARSQVTKGNVWHEEFGWLPQSQLQKYIDGKERYYKGGWVKVEKEAELRRDFKNAWEVRTDHYLVKTNVSLERGVELGNALEDFYEFFHETFAGFFNSPEQLKKLFDGPGASVRPGGKPFVVHYYRTREEYLNQLRKNFPSIDQTNGIYLTSDHVAHFYEDKSQNSEGTLFHEATHQLFFESHREDRAICENHHFWIIEGIACYMESFQRKGGSFSVGDPDYIRFVGARDNLLQKKYYVPLREFSGLGMQEFQGTAELAKNYTQAAGLARFLMHYKAGRYREAPVDHLAQLYSNHKQTRDNAQGLDELTGIELEELDRQYREDAIEIEKALKTVAK